MRVADGETRSERRAYRVPLRFGTERADQDAFTRDLSEAGLFVLTEKPLAPGTKVQLRLSLEACSLPLRGVVTWKSDTDSDDQPGMGINLLRPPALYHHFVSTLG